MELVKALHIIAVISWMAGLLYLPRLFVYHAGSKAGSEQSETFKVMERRLLKAIMLPAMLASWGLGLWLGWSKGWGIAWWFWVKFALVLVMSGFHGFLAVQVRAFSQDRNVRTAGFYRMANEVPTVLMIGIVVLAVLKPF